MNQPSKAWLQMMDTAIVVLLCYYNSATVIQGYFSKKFTQSVFESVFQSVMCFSHVLRNQMHVHIRLPLYINPVITLCLTHL